MLMLTLVMDPVDMGCLAFFFQLLLVSPCIFGAWVWCFGKLRLFLFMCGFIFVSCKTAFGFR
jgi:hypothetical protein